MHTIPEPAVGYGRIEEMIYGTITEKLLLAAIELELFDTLSTPMSAEDAAAAMDTHPRSTRVMLRALTALGLLTHRNGVFRNSPESDDFLNSQSPACITEWLVRSARNFEPVIRNISEIARKGPAETLPEHHMNSEEMCDFYTHSHAQTELAGIAAKTAALVRELPERQEFTRMLDLGCGPGLNSVAILRDHPGLSATLFDREPVVAVAGEWAERFGLSGRVETMAGDYGRDDLGQGYDFILVSDTMYYQGEELDRMTRKLFHALAPGGVFMGIHGVLTHDRTAPCKLVLGMLPDTLMDQGELPDSGFLAPSLLRAGFGQVHTRKVDMVSNEMEVDIAKKP